MSKAQAARLKKGVPGELKNPDLCRWTLIRWEPSKNGDQQLIPVGRPSGFTAACFEYEHPEYCDGAAGLALKILPSGGVFAVFLRGARTADGVLKPWAEAVLDRLHSYGEAAGTDVVILSRCPKNRVRKKYWFSVPGASDPGEGVEILGNSIVPISGVAVDKTHQGFGNIIPDLKELADSGEIIEQAKAPSRRRAKKNQFRRLNSGHEKTHEKTEHTKNSFERSTEEGVKPGCLQTSASGRAIDQSGVSSRNQLGTKR